MKLRHIIFDCDGVLVDSEPMSMRADVALLKRYGIEVSEAEARRRFVGTTFQAMLDLTNVNPAYRLGRLFATLEKIQEEASPGLNATIRDRYYGAASSTPVAVFTTLLRLKNHHLGKLNKGRAIQMERTIGEITNELNDFPRILALPEQGRFALGYYHQRQAFFTKSESPTTDTPKESK